MQIPYAGGEWAIHGERARQATQTLPRDGRREVDNIDTLTHEDSRYSPRIRQRQESKQGNNGLVPGGFIHHILMDHAPGIQLNKKLF
ncbi:hypothetical protein BDV06DRAFT_195511 [Aspergillus oleicola]